MSKKKPRAYPGLPAALPSPVADSHTHLDMSFDDVHLPVSEALKRAEDVGVAAAIQVGTDVHGSQVSVDLARQWPQLWAAVALHPNEAPRLLRDEGRDALEVAWDDIERLAAQPVVRAIGETGMDFYHTDDSGRDIQEESFRRHIDFAKTFGKTLVIHDRDAHADVLRILDDAGAPDTVVLHCFSGDVDFAQEAVTRGFYCSFAGNVTFKNAQTLRDAAAVIPEELILVETDAPFLTPMPHRGQPNSSYLIPWTVQCLAETRNVELDAMCQALWDNTERAFGPLLDTSA